jgi:hypothetical protein
MEYDWQDALSSIGTDSIFIADGAAASYSASSK